MGLLGTLPNEELTPSRFWLHLPQETRLAAAKALYAHDWGESPTKREADYTIMRRMNFREQAVRQLPVGRRAHYLATAARPDDSLAQSLLLAHHLENRRSILTAFLDALAIPHNDGLISEEHHLAPPSEEALAGAAEALLSKFPEDDVELYLLTLLILDQNSWRGLAPWLDARRAKAVGA